MRAQIETERLFLRKLTMEDADAVFRWGGDPQVNQYMIYPLYTRVEDVRTWIKSLNPDDPDNYDFGFVRKDTSELIGQGGLVFHPARDVWVVGYNLRADQWGNGFTIEALNGIIAHIKRNRVIHVIEGTVAVDNHNSMRIMEKLGMTCVGDTAFEKLDGSRVFDAKVYRREEQL